MTYPISLRHCASWHMRSQSQTVLLRSVTPPTFATKHATSPFTYIWADALTIFYRSMVNWFTVLERMNVPGPKPIWVFGNAKDFRNKVGNRSSALKWTGTFSICDILQNQQVYTRQSQLDWPSANSQRHLYFDKSTEQENCNYFLCIDFSIEPVNSHFQIEIISNLSKKGRTPKDKPLNIDRWIVGNEYLKSHILKSFLHK